MDVQGFVRVRRENRLVFRDWQEKADCLPLIRFLKMDQVEGEVLTGLIDPAEAVRAVVDMGASEVMRRFRLPQHRNSYVVLFPVSVKTVKKSNLYR